MVPGDPVQNTQSVIFKKRLLDLLDPRQLEHVLLMPLMKKRAYIASLKAPLWAAMMAWLKLNLLMSDSGAAVLHSYGTNWGFILQDNSINPCSLALSSITMQGLPWKKWFPFLGSQNHQAQRLWVSNTRLEENRFSVFCLLHSFHQILFWWHVMQMMRFWTYLKLYTKEHYLENAPEFVGSVFWGISAEESHYWPVVN